MKCKRYGVLLFLPAVLLIASCATLLHLHVTYRLPQIDSRPLKGRKVFLSFDDQRDAKEVFGRGARQAFENISENFSLSLARGEDAGFKLGVYELPPLFLEVFKRRLEHEGMGVVPSRDAAELELNIVLHTFSLDLVGRSWQVAMAYTGRLLSHGEERSRQRISSNAERMKLIRQREADIVLGEMVTDAVNQLDLNRLFQTGGSMGERVRGP